MENVRHTCAKAGLQADIKKERLKPESLPDCTPMGSRTPIDGTGIHYSIH